MLPGPTSSSASSPGDEESVYEPGRPSARLNKSPDVWELEVQLTQQGTTHPVK